MAKTSKNKSEPLTPEEVIKYKPKDQAADLQQILGFDLTTAYQVGLELDTNNPANVVKTVSPATKLGNVDALPETKK